METVNSPDDSLLEEAKVPDSPGDSSPEKAEVPELVQQAIACLARNGITGVQPSEIDVASQLFDGFTAFFRPKGTSFQCLLEDPTYVKDFETRKVYRF